MDPGQSVETEPSHRSCTHVGYFTSAQDLISSLAFLLAQLPDTRKSSAQSEAFPSENSPFLREKFATCTLYYGAERLANGMG